MGKRLLMKGNEAIGEAAILAGCRAYFCYPITPQTEVAEYLAKRMPEVGGTFLQGESEVAVSYMLFGAAGGGSKVFTTSSSPGISLMAEGMSYIAAAELPVVIINVMRNGPGLGGILPSQSDYLQSTKGAGHGDYKFLVFGPSSVQETVDIIIESFSLAEKYSNPVMVAVDGMIGQMMEPVEIPEFEETPSSEIAGHGEWASIGVGNGGPRDKHIVKTLFLNPEASLEHNIKLRKKYDVIEANEVRYEEVGTGRDLDVLIVSFGTMARISKTAVEALEADGLRVGMLRPISLYPFPYDKLRELASRTKLVVSVEMSMGQMIEDVRLGVEGRAPVKFFGKAGGIVPIPCEVVEGIKALVEQ